MNYSFHPEAEKEFLEAIDYYEGRKEGLGFDFPTEVYAAIGRAAEHPKSWPILEGDVRRCQTSRFPLGCALFGRGRGCLCPCRDAPPRVLRDAVVGLTRRAIEATAGCF